MRQSQYLEEMIIILEKFLAKFGGEAIPCTKEEVEVLESMLPHPYRLPAAYKEFLLYGGKKSGNLFNMLNISDKQAKFSLDIKYRDFFDGLDAFGGNNERLPSDIFVIEEWQSYSFTYFLLTEGEDPPIYFWHEDKGGLEDSEKINDNFSGFLREKIGIQAKYMMAELFWKEFRAGKPPRSKQFWISTITELSQGIVKEELMKYFGLSFSDLEEVTSIIGVDPNSYLEELSGWKCRKVSVNDNGIRFFVPETNKE